MPIDLVATEVSSCPDLFRELRRSATPFITGLYNAESCLGRVYASVVCISKIGGIDSAYDLMGHFVSSFCPEIDPSLRLAESATDILSDRLRRSALRVGPANNMAEVNFTTVGMARFSQDMVVGQGLNLNHALVRHIGELASATSQYSKGEARKIMSAMSGLADSIKGINRSWRIAGLDKVLPTTKRHYQQMEADTALIMTKLVRPTSLVLSEPAAVSPATASALIIA